MDLNLRPAAYKAAAMPTELWGPGVWLAIWNYGGLAELVLEAGFSAP